MWIQIRSSFGSLCPRNRRSGLLQTRRGNYVRVAPHPRGAALKFRGVSAQRIFAPSIPLRSQTPRCWDPIGLNEPGDGRQFVGEGISWPKLFEPLSHNTEPFRITLLG